MCRPSGLVNRQVGLRILLGVGIKCVPLFERASESCGVLTAIARVRGRTLVNLAFTFSSSDSESIKMQKMPRSAQTVLRLVIPHIHTMQIVADPLAVNKFDLPSIILH